MFEFYVERKTKSTGCVIHYPVEVFQVTENSYETLEHIKTNMCDVGNDAPDHLTFIRTDK